MAAVTVTLHGVFYPDAKRGRAADDQPWKGTFVGLAWNPDLGVGGGPVYPPDIDPPPIDPPIDPPPPDPAPGLTTVAKPPPPGGGWAFFPEYGWLYYPSGAQPKTP